MSRHLGVYAANRVYLYKRGNACDTVSGGWAAKIGSSGPDNFVTFESGYIQLQGADNRSNYCAIAVTKQELSKYRKLCARLKCTNMNRARLCYYTTVPGGTTLSGEQAPVFPTVNNTETTIELALTSATPDGFPAVLADNGGVNAVYGVWMER